MDAGKWKASFVYFYYARSIYELFISLNYNGGIPESLGVSIPGHILFQSEKCKIGLQSSVIVFVCTREPILSLFLELVKYWNSMPGQENWEPLVCTLES